MSRKTVFQPQVHHRKESYEIYNSAPGRPTVLRALDGTCDLVLMRNPAHGSACLEGCEKCWYPSVTSCGCSIHHVGPSCSSTVVSVTWCCDPGEHLCWEWGTEQLAYVCVCVCVWVARRSKWSVTDFMYVCFSLPLPRAPFVAWWCASVDTKKPLHSRCPGPLLEICIFMYF